MADKALHQKIDKVLECAARLDETVKNMAKDVEFLVVSDRKQEEKINKHEMTLYGEGGKNGLVGDNKMLKRAFYGANAIAGLIMGAIYFFRESIISIFQQHGGAK